MQIWVTWRMSRPRWTCPGAPHLQVPTTPYRYDYWSSDAPIFVWAVCTFIVSSLCHLLRCGSPCRPIFVWARYAHQLFQQAARRCHLCSCGMPLSSAGLESFLYCVCATRCRPVRHNACTPYTDVDKGQCPYLDLMFGVHIISMYTAIVFRLP